jgi:hypothetical protein
VVHGAYLFVLPIEVQAGLELAAVAAAGRNDTNFSLCNVAWGHIPWAKGSGC